ncbi:hypothetical protein INR49_006529 [Caranx melampygus]|nr:hypothetical protein INR49_006529 [Caranx melampygus]
MVVMKMKFPFEKRVKLAQGLWLLSWFATVAGAITFTLGCILKTELRRRAEVMDNSDIHIVPNTLMIVGLASLGINYFSSKICQDALDAGRFPRWKTFLKPYFAISCFFTVLMLLAVIMSYAMKGSLDRIKSNVDGRYLLDGVPFSCCNPSSPRPCIQYQLTNNSAHYNYDYQTEELNIYLRGCREALVHYYMGLMNTIGAGVLSVFLLQGSVLVSLRFLQTSMEALAGNENTEIETEGYLLEKSVKDTIMEYLDPVLKFLLLTNQVEEGTPAATTT